MAWLALRPVRRGGLAVADVAAAVAPAMGLLALDVGLVLVVLVLASGTVAISAGAPLLRRRHFLLPPSSSTERRTMPVRFPC